MSRWIATLSTVLLLVLLKAAVFAISPSLASTSRISEQRAREILRQIDDLWRGKSSHAVMTMQVKTEHYTRTLQMEAWSKGTSMSLVRITRPLKEKGTATLKSANNIFSYLPKTDRTIRLASGMMMGSWMGSHFTNDDLVKESRLELDYTPTVSFEGQRDGQSVIEFTLLPHEDAAVVWGKIVLVVRRTDLIPVTETYYDEDMQVARTLTFSRLEKLAGRLRPAELKMVPADKPDEYTRVVYDSLQMDVPIADSFFSLANLKRSR